MVTVKCMKCSTEQHRNILFNLNELEIPDGFPLLGKFIKGRCPLCGFEILIGIDDI